MPNVLFDIPNPPSNTIILDETRKGRVQFTVNNVSGRPLMRVAARLTPMPDAAAAYGKWLKLDPDGFREFKIADSLQYAALIDVPAAGAAGNYAFRLDVWDDANPDDTLVNGPSITFTVPAPPVKPPATFPWWIPVVIVAVIVLIVGIVLITRPGPAPVITPTATTTAIATQTSTPTPTPTTTPTPPPAIGNFDGHWNLAGASQSAGASADLQQNGINVVGTYFNGTIPGTISGFISGNTLSGQYRTQFGGGVFTWVLTNNSSTQFQGTWDTNNDWCGFRNGSVQPVPCHPSLIIRIPIDIRDKVLKITLVAPSP